MVLVTGDATAELLQLAAAQGVERAAPEQIRQAMAAQGLPDEVPDRLLGYLADHVERPGPSRRTWSGCSAAPR